MLHAVAQPDKTKPPETRPLDGNPQRHAEGRHGTVGSAMEVGGARASVPILVRIRSVSLAPHPFPPKLSLDQADEIRRLRARGLPLAELAGRFGVAKSSVSAIVHLKAHVPNGALRVALPKFEAALLDEIAEDEGVPVEKLAADLLVEALRSRAW